MNTVRRYLLNCWLVFASTIVVIVAVCAQVGTRGFAQRRVHGIARWWARGMLRITGTRVSVEGLENVSTPGPYVIMCNHRSHLDTPVLIEHVLFFGFIVKKELMKIPIFSTAMKSIDGCEPLKGLCGSGGSRRCFEGRCGGKNILIFPEGTRAPDDDLSSFQERWSGHAAQVGGAHLTYRCQWNGSSDSRART